MKSRRFIQIICFSLMLIILPWAEAQYAGGPQDTHNTGQARSDDDYLPEKIFITGSAVQENGASAVGAYIELDCRGSVTREATVEASGRFSFQLGDSIRFKQHDQDLGQDATNPFGINSDTIPFNVGLTSTGMPRRPKKLSSLTKLTGCALRASLSGYKSSIIELGTTTLSVLNDVGTIVLSPIEKVRGATVSSTSLLAPKPAKKAMEKAKMALRKSEVSNAEKYLKSAIALYPKYAEAWFLVGRLYQNQRRINEAREAYMKAMESDDLYVPPHIWLGLISAAEQKWQDAANHTERALTLDPTAIPEAYYVNALANFNLRNMVQAEKSALRTELMDSTHRFPKLHLILASIFADRNDIVGSIEELRKYLKYGPRGKLTIQKHEEALYMESNWETASESLKREMASNAGPEVRLMLAEALLGAGMADQAKSELTAFLEGGDIMKIPPQLRDLLKHDQDLAKDKTISLASNEKTGTQRGETIDYLHYSLRDLPDFEIASDQAPLDGILAAVGNNVASLFANLFNLSAVESVQLERVDRKGKVDQGRSFEYLYLCLGAIDKKEPYFDEFRSDAQGHELLQLGLDEGYMLTAGFVSAPLIFHPIHQNGNSFRLLGYQKLRGRNTFAVAYAQIPDKCSLKGYFRAGKNVQEIFKQGIAWIDVENYQIIRIVSDLLQPFPQIRLEKLRTEIDFDKARFNQAKEEFWLPVQVVVTVKWNDRILRNTHSYSDFKMFDVQTSQRIEKPKDVGSALEAPADSSQPPIPPAK